MNDLYTYIDLEYNIIFLHVRFEGSCSHDMRKDMFITFEHQRRRPSYATAQSDISIIIIY